VYLARGVVDHEQAGGQLTGQYDASHLESLPALFMRIFWYGLIAGLVMLLLTPFLKRMMVGVR